MKILEVNNLKSYFHTKDGVVKAVDDVSFSLNKGEAIGLVGESGSGKTTLALSITRLLPAGGKIAGGEVILDGEDLTTLSYNELRKHRWKDISIAFQGAMNALNPVIRVGEQIAETIMFHEKVSYQEARRRTEELLELVEIDKNRIDNYPHEFSGGMKQRVMIAMAIANNPKVMIGDEPTTALDVMVQAQILDLLERLRREMNMSLILITHDLSVLAETCDKAAVMYAGKIVEIGPTEAILENYQHPYTEKLVESFPNVYKKRELIASIPGAPPNLIDPPSGCYFHPRCDYANEECSKTMPNLTKVGEDHYVACHRGESHE